MHDKVILMGVLLLAVSALIPAPICLALIAAQDESRLHRIGGMIVHGILAVAIILLWLVVCRRTVAMLMAFSG